MLKSIVTLIMTLLLYGTSIAGIPNPAGEEELFGVQDISAEGNLYKRGNAGVYFGFAGVLRDRYSKDILAYESNTYLQLGLTVQGHYDLLRNLRGYIELPYTAKLGFVEKETSPLPGPEYEFEANTGFSDFVAGATWYALLQDQSPVNVTSQTEVVLPFGECRFDPEYEGYFELGNGFGQLSLGVGVSRTVSPAVLLFANGAHVTRFSRTFTRRNYKLKLEPDNVEFLSVGIGFLIGKNYQLNIQMEQASVGAIKYRSYAFEPKYTYKSYGLKFIANSKKHGIPPYTAFVGVDEIKGKTYFAFGYYWPIGFRLFGIDF